MFARFLPLAASVRLSRAGTAPDARLDRRYREDVLARARALMGAVALVAIYLDPTEPAHFAGLAYSLLVAYVVYGASLLILLRARPIAGPRFATGVHVIDILWAAVISLFTSGPNSAFFVFFVFVILASGFRWGMRETLVTTGVLAVILFGETLLAASNVGTTLGEGVEVNRVVLRSVYLLIVGFFAGYLGEKEKQAQLEAAFIGEELRELGAKTAFDRAIQPVLARLMTAFGASAGVAVLEDVTTGTALVLERAAGQPQDQPWRELSPYEARDYLFPVAGVVARLPGGEPPAQASGVDEPGRLLPAAAVAERPARFREPSAPLLLVADLLSAPEWRARLILVNPAVGGRDDHALRFLHRLVQNLGPAVHNLLLVDRARREAVTIERARVARQIHDNSLQALASIELQMQALEREALFEPDLAARAGRLRRLLHEEALNLRDLMHALQPGDVRPDDLPGALADLVERHERETGIAALFVSDGAAIDLPPATCREIAGLVREALVNVRKHSAARHVTVRLERSTESWALTIEDDGRGFDFAGELSVDELDERRKGPRVIKERVRALGATMTLASTPGKRSRLRIVIPAS